MTCGNCVFQVILSSYYLHISVCAMAVVIGKLAHALFYVFCFNVFSSVCVELIDRYPSFKLAIKASSLSSGVVGSRNRTRLSLLLDD
jgi:hypothetical protein